ncbi:MAG: hypothetical protein ABI200_06710, partial [Gaiellales bacterium]
EALNRIATVSVIALAESTTLRPEALGCGKRYRDPARAADAGAASRGGGNKPASKPRDARERGRDGDRPFTDRGPKVSKDALGSSKHDSAIADDLDPDTRAKLEAMRKALES